MPQELGWEGKCVFFLGLDSVFFGSSRPYSEGTVSQNNQAGGVNTENEMRPEVDRLID